MRNGNIEDIYELSPLQQGLLLHSLHDGAADMYLSQHTYAIDGPLDTGVLLQAWQSVSAAHAVLRTSFHWDGLDKPLQVVHRDVPIPVHHRDWSADDEAGQHERLLRLQTEDRAAGFDPAAPPLQRLHVIRLGEGRHRLLWTYHHLLMDGWSVPNFLDEVMSWYRALTFGTPPPTAVPAYRSYIAWLQRQDLREARDFWSATLADLRPSQVAQFRPADPRHGTGSVDRRHVHLPDALTDGLRQAAAHHRVTFGTLVQAATAIVFQCYTGQPEIVFGCVTSGRPAELPQVGRMVGLFANTLPLRVAIPEDGDLGSWLRDLQNAYAAMRRYEFTPLADIKKLAGLAGQQAYDSLLVLENYTPTIDTDPGPVPAGQALRFSVETLYDKTDLPLTVSVAPPPASELQLLIHRDRFEPDFIDDIRGRLDRTLDALITAERIAPVVAAAGPRPVRRAEPVAAPARERSSTLTPPATPEEEAIAATFREILGYPDIDVTVSFFELGGDSLEAVRVASRIDGASVGLLTANPSVRELARALAAAASDDGPAGDLDGEIAELERLLDAKRAAREQQARPDRVVPVPRDATMPCTHQQEGLWFLHQLDPESTVYHVPFALRLHGPLDVGALERAIGDLVVRHEALRTRFVEVDGRPRQVIDPPAAAHPLPVTAVDAERVREWAAGVAHRPFDLAAGPLFRAALARLGPDEYALVLVAHHIVADGWSAGILAEELAVRYAGGELPPLDIQSADHAVWQRDRLNGAELDRQMGFWREELADLSTVDFPTDRPRPAQPTGAGAWSYRQVPDDLAAAARGYAKTHQVSFLAVLQAALLTVLHRYTGQDDLAIGSVFSGRTRPEIEPVVGFFTNTLVLRTNAGGRPSFAELVARCNATVLDATERQDVPLGLVVDALQPERVAGRNPLFQISLILQPAGTLADLKLGNVTAESIDITDSRSRFDFLINVTDDGHALELAVEYSTELFDADRLERLLDHYTAALTHGLDTPNLPADDLDILPPAERHRVLHEFVEATETRAYVLDGSLRPTPIGVTGRLFLGAGTEIGSPDRPGRTAERFLADPYAATPGRRMYASGELVRWRADGVLEYLASPSAGPQPPRTEHVAPRTDTERWLAAQWQDLLGVERVGAHDSFFQLGANSLHATQLFARIREGLRVELDPRHVFTSQVLEQLAARLDESAPAKDIDPIEPVPRGGPLPCTHQQESLWSMHQLNPSSTVYHIPFALRLRGALDLPALERAIVALVARHEALRTRFVEVDGRPCQVIDPAPEEFSLPTTELTADQVVPWATELIGRPFELAAGSLFRVAAAELAPDECALVLVVHHIIADGASLRILADELSRLYAAETGGGPAHLAPLRVQPGDHAVWQRNRLDEAELTRQMSHWRTALAGLSTVNFPTDRPRPAQPTAAGANLNRPVPDTVTAAARAYATANQVSFLAVLHAPLLTVLRRYTGQQDLTVGSVFSGRTRAEIESVVGFFVNTLVLRNDLGGEPTFAELIRRCHTTVLDATERQDVPFGLVVDAVAPERVPGRNPLFQISLTLQPAGIRADLTLGELTAEPIELPGGDARFDIALDLADDGEALELWAEYSTELFDADRIERFLDHYLTALAHGLAAPDTPVDDIDIMSSAERERVLRAFNPVAGPESVAAVPSGKGA